MTSLIDVQELNLYAASIFTDDGPGAMLALRSGLEILNALANATDTTATQPLRTNTAPSFRDGPPIRQSTYVLQCLQNKEHYICHRPLVMDIDQVDGMQFDEVFPLFEAALLFNMALACHQDGHDTQDKAPYHASMFYEFSYFALQKSRALPSATRALSLLVLNNMAVVHYEICHYETVAMCREVALSLIPTTISCSDCFLGEGTGALIPGDRQGILLNVWLLFGPRVTARAA